MRTCDKEVWTKVLLATLQGGRQGSAESIAFFVDKLVVEIAERDKIGEMEANRDLDVAARVTNGTYRGPFHCPPHSPNTIREALAAHPDWKYDERDGRFSDGGFHDCELIWNVAPKGSRLCELCAMNRGISPIKE